MGTGLYSEGALAGWSWMKRASHPMMAKAIQQHVYLSTLGFNLRLMLVWEMSYTMNRSLPWSSDVELAPGTQETVGKVQPVHINPFRKEASAGPGEPRGEVTASAWGDPERFLEWVTLEH